MEKRTAKNIITIGASAGGFSAVSRLLSKIPADLDVAIFVVIHIGKDALIEILHNVLSQNAVFPVIIPVDEEEILPQRIYLAPPDSHMMVTKEVIRIKKGAKENHWRPSIDVLFRTAAAAYDSCVVGIVLTGLLDDGTSGMEAIKKCGGICIVQEPKDAEFPDMPNNVLNKIEVDYQTSIDDMGYILSDLYAREDCQTDTIPEDVKLEAEITLRMSSGYDKTVQLGNPTSFTCPDCGGVLTEIEEDGELRYRCFTGHAFTEKVLERDYKNKVEETLWVAIRMMEERRNLLHSLAEKTNSKYPKDRTEREQELLKHIDRLKSIMLDIGTLNIN